MKLTREQQLNKLYQAVAELLVEKAKVSLPEAGSFRKITVGGNVKGEICHSILGIEESYSSQTERYVTLGVYREGEDRVVSNYLFKGTKQEVLEWLESPEGLTQIIEAYEHLEEKVKDWD